MSIASNGGVFIITLREEIRLELETMTFTNMVSDMWMIFGIFGTEYLINESNYYIINTVKYS